jgi:hypothetical protein
MGFYALSNSNRLYPIQEYQWWRMFINEIS